MKGFHSVVVEKDAATSIQRKFPHKDLDFYKVISLVYKIANMAKCGRRFFYNITEDSQSKKKEIQCQFAAKDLFSTHDQCARE